MGQIQQELLTVKSKTARVLRSNGFSKSMKYSHQYWRKSNIKEGYVFDTFFHPDYQKEVVSLSYFPYDPEKIQDLYNVLVKNKLPEILLLEEYQIVIIPSTYQRLVFKMEKEFAV